MMVLSSTGSRTRQRYVQCRRSSFLLFLVGSLFPAAVLAESSRAACGVASSPGVVLAFVNSPPVSSTTPISRKLLRDDSSHRPSSSSWCVAGAVAGHGTTNNLPRFLFDTRLPPTTSSSVVGLSATSPGGSNGVGRPPSPVAAVAFLAIAVSYWYLLVLGAAAAANHWPVPVPDFIPLTPGWPPTDADLAPALEDSAHFFYIRDLLEHFHLLSPGNGESSSVTTTPPPPALRLALFNIAEAWVFAFLPVLLTDDRRRLPTPVVWFTWLGALGLTNAFLAPYLAMREIRPLLLGAADDGITASGRGRNSGERALSVAVGILAAAVVTYALAQTLNVILAEGAAGQIEALRTLIVSDRTYLAFCVDLVLFATFQAWLMRDVVVADEAAKTPGGGGGGVSGGAGDDWIYSVPFFGLLAWLFRRGA